MRTIFYKTAFIAVCGITTACGDAVFSSGSGSRKSTADLNPNNSSDNPKADSLTWFWACETSSTPPPTPATDKDIVLTGEGPHEISPTVAADVPITIQGEICPISAPRDLVFVVDVSGSMQGALGTGNDPVVAGSCGRLQALQQVITSNSNKGDVRSAVTTFSDGRVATSNGFFTSLEAMFPSQALVDVICAHSGNTNYTAGMKEAQLLFQQTAEGTSKELYFISDGEPNDKNNVLYNGTVEATAMKAEGVTIASIMLGASFEGDVFLKTHIASKNEQGIAYHAQVGKAADLEKALSTLANNDLASGQMTYRAIGTQDWTTIDLIKFRNSDTFSIPGITINLQSAPNGLEMNFEYQDRLGKKFGGAGQIVWQQTN